MIQLRCISERQEDTSFGPNANRDDRHRSVLRFGDPWTAPFPGKLSWVQDSCLPRSELRRHYVRRTGRLVLRINPLYDVVVGYYHVITILTGAMASKYVCKACNRACGRDVTHVCDQTWSDCMASPPCAFSHFRYSCAECNRHFRSRTCFPNHKQRTLNKKFCVWA